MRIELTDEKALRLVPVSALRSYAIAEGWKQSGKYGKTSFIYTRSESPDLLIPRSKSIDDYATAVARFIEAVSSVEERNQLNVYRDLLQFQSDIIRVRAKTSSADGSIDLDDGVNVFLNAREMLLSAACAAREPKRSYRVGSHKEALTYIERVRLGQTEQGSYVIAMLSPVPVREDDQYDDLLGHLGDHTEPFERKVTRTLMTSLSEARRAAHSPNDAAIDAFEGAVAKGVNANLCDALASLIEHGHGLDVTASWAKFMPDVEGPSKVHFRSQDAEIFREAAIRLRDAEPQRNARIEGYVRLLAREQDSQEGTVTFKAIVDEKLVSVKANLDRDMYSQAIEAHGSRKTVSIRGNLERQGARWHLTSPHDFLIHDDFEDLLG